MSFTSGFLFKEKKKREIIPSPCSQTSPFLCLLSKKLLPLRFVKAFADVQHFPSSLSSFFFFLLYSKVSLKKLSSFNIQRVSQKIRRKTTHCSSSFFIFPKDILLHPNFLLELSFGYVLFSFWLLHDNILGDSVSFFYKFSIYKLYNCFSCF